MSVWRRKAIETIPEIRDAIERCWSPMALWVELLFVFDKALVGGDMALAKRIVAYARYCIDARSPDVRTAVACAFIEHLADTQMKREHLPALITPKEFREWRPIIAYHAEADVLDALEVLFRQLRQPRPWM